MTTRTQSIRWHFILITAIAVTAFFILGLTRIEIDTDILSSIPHEDPVITDAAYIFKNHPIQDQVAIDIATNKVNLDLLIKAGKAAEEHLKESNLFQSVGTHDVQKVFPQLIGYLMETMPSLFTYKELKNRIEPKITEQAVEKALTNRFMSLMDLQGIGQSAFIAQDPLGLSEMLISKLSHLIPTTKAKIYQGNLVSSDDKHLLLLARPKSSGTDTSFAKRIEQTIGELEQKLNRLTDTATITITPVGSYRAALDNEEMAKSDTELALLMATIGIAILLFFAFPRPYIGILSLVPAVAGTMTALFFYSLIHNTISILAIGFGGAIISITVDHGIAYLLFLDRKKTTSGYEASREVWAIGLFATLTTMGAFFTLTFSGFQILAQIGQFAAFGIGLSFLFVHTIFPRIFIKMPPARKSRTLFLKSFTAKLASSNKYKPVIALLFFTIMLFFAKPEFLIDLNSMNTVSHDTIRAEKLITDNWGSVFNKVYIMNESENLNSLIQNSDTLISMIDEDINNKSLSTAFIPASLFPGDTRKNENFKAWKRFWTGRKVNITVQAMKGISKRIGFSADAFNPFFEILKSKNAPPTEINETYARFLGIVKNREKNKWLQMSTITPGKGYNSEIFFKRYSGKGKIFDPFLFSQRLGNLLSSTFIKMIGIIGISVLALLIIFFMDIKLVALACTPVIFSLISTLGTLKIIGHPLDIPALMLSIIIFGMGIDYSLFIIRSYQRNPDEGHDTVHIIRLTVFLAAVSTMIGFGSLIFASHSLLRSAGITSFFGIFYSLTGAYLILPPLLNKMYKPIIESNETVTAGSKEHFKRVMRRYKHMEAYPRLFARFKIITDPMFPELAEYISSPGNIIDIGTGYGVPAVWLLELYPETTITGIEPDFERTIFASKIIGERGTVTQGSAPEIPAAAGKADTALMLDMSHHLNDDDFLKTLAGLKKSLRKNGTLVMRSTIPKKKRTPLLRIAETIRLRFNKEIPMYRSVEGIKEALVKTGFRITVAKPSGNDREETWFIGKA